MTVSDIGVKLAVARRTARRTTDAGSIPGADRVGMVGFGTVG